MPDPVSDIYNALNNKLAVPMMQGLQSLGFFGGGDQHHVATGIDTTQGKNAQGQAVDYALPPSAAGAAPGSALQNALASGQIGGQQVVGTPQTGFSDPSGIPTKKPTTPPDDALTMGLGMFFKQYLAPLMQQVNQQDNALNQNWGNAMQAALKNPLPPGVASIMQSQVPMDQLLMGMQQRGAAQQAGNIQPLQTLFTALQGNTAAQQAFADALTKAVTYQELGIGSPVQLGNLLQSALGGPNTLVGGLASLLSSGSGLNLTPQNPAVAAAAANQNAGAGYTGTTPTG